MARSIVDICNEALGEVPASLITSMDEGSIGARHCQRLYPKVVEDLAEIHDWDFMIRRVTLAQITNDRKEWCYAYALPTDIGSPRKLIPNYGDIRHHVAPARFDQIEDSIAYQIAANKLYTNLDQATLEYTISDPDPGRFTSLFSRAVAMELASRLVMPILNDRQRQGDLIKEAELAKGRAIADDINRNRNTDLDFVSEAAMARGVDRLSR
jgi:hypothetical protein